MGVQSQMIMQNININPNPHLHQRSYYNHDQCNSSVVTSVNNNNAAAACNLFPVADWLTEMRSVANRGDQVDVDSYINFQTDKLRKMVQEQRRIELAWLVKKFEARTLFLMRQKEEQIRQLMLRSMELQRLTSALQLENESLHNLARENQATIESLNQAIVHLHEFSYNHLAEDAESCCDEVDMTPQRESSERLRLICGGCELREANVVFLPCRHLCACDVCESEMHLCPFCKMQKSSSIMTLVF